MCPLSKDKCIVICVIVILLSIDQYAHISMKQPFFTVYRSHTKFQLYRFGSCSVLAPTLSIIVLGGCAALIPVVLKVFVARDHFKCKLISTDRLSTDLFHDCYFLSVQNDIISNQKTIRMYCQRLQKKNTPCHGWLRLRTPYPTKHHHKTTWPKTDHMTPSLALYRQTFDCLFNH